MIKSELDSIEERIRKLENTVFKLRCSIGDIILYLDNINQEFSRIYQEIEQLKKGKHK